MLLVEDDAADVRLIRLSLEAVAQPCDLTAIGNGQEALDYLLCRGEHLQAQRPDLVLLDLKLPGMNGWTVLRTIKQHPRLRCLPVIVFTTSSEPQDVHEVYHCHGNSYLAKPTGIREWERMMQGLADFWFRLALLPGAPEQDHHELAHAVD